MSSNAIDSSFIQRICVAIILVFVFIAGTLGNSVVIWVYCRRRDGQTATFFIIVLAAADLIVCLLVTPFVLSMEWMNYKTDSEILCKGFYFLNISNSMFSSLLISAVALDRYLCICHPMREILTVGRAKLLVASLAIFSWLMGIMSAMNVKVMLRKSEDIYSTPMMEEEENTTMMDTTFYVCEEMRYTENITLTQKIFYEIVQKANHISFIFCIIVVIACYSLVYRVVLRLRGNEKYLVASKHDNSQQYISTMTYNGNEEKSQMNPPPAVEQIPTERKTNHKSSLTSDKFPLHSSRLSKHSSGPSCPGGATEIKGVNTSTTINFHQTSLHSVSGHSKKSFFQFRRRFADSRHGERIQNLRSAAMLFVVAVVYILVFTPAILMASNILNINIVIFNLYYLNNVSNPVIYCFMNRGFRQQLRRIIFRRKFT